MKAAARRGIIARRPPRNRDGARRPPGNRATARRPPRTPDTGDSVDHVHFAALPGMRDCTLTVCGDSFLGASEGCDDGNSTDGDGCSSSCQIPCFAQQPTVNAVPPNLVLVLDKSGSMTADFGGATRWDTLVQVVADVTTTYENVVKFGAKWYPTAEKCENQTQFDCTSYHPVFGDCQSFIADGAACDVDPGFDSNQLKPDLNNSMSIVNALPVAADIDGYCWTPSQQGFEESLAALKAEVPDPAEDRSPVEDLDALEQELRQYGDMFDGRPRVVALNKVDSEEGAALIAETQAALRARNIPLFPISAHTHEGLDRLLR